MEEWDEENCDGYVEHPEFEEESKLVGTKIVSIVMELWTCERCAEPTIEIPLNLPIGTPWEYKCNVCGYHVEIVIGRELEGKFVVKEPKRWKKVVQ